MTIKSIRIYRYTLPFVEPIRLGDQLHHTRDGLLVELTGSSGQTGWGECVPLPCFSNESIEEALQQLKRVQAEIAESSCSPDRLLELIPELYPSVQFALESALLNLMETQNQAVPPSPVALNGLITDSEDAVALAKQLASDGYRSIKLKIGRKPLEVEIQMIRAVAQQLPPNVTLRLDANRAWSMHEAKRFHDALRGLPIEYIEEPLSDPAKLLQLAQLAPIPIALDESFREKGGEALLESGRFKAIVLKPTLTGGPARIKQIAKIAQQLKVKVVISSAYESGLGINQLARLASDVAPETLHGLDTLLAFESDLISNHLSPDAGRLQPISAGEIEIDRSRLTELANE